MKEKQGYTVWIEAEHWVANTWFPDNTNTDVMVSWETGERWIASFITYKQVQTLTDKNRKTGENLSGAYFWTSDMILVDEASRHRIEEIIRDLVETDYFESVFKRSRDD